MPFEEGQDFLADLHRVRFKGKVAGVIEHHLGFGVVALVSLSARRDYPRLQTLRPPIQTRTTIRPIRVGIMAASAFAAIFKICVIV
jgi:hypothetical protein